MSSTLAASRIAERHALSGLPQGRTPAAPYLALFFVGAYALAYVLWGLVALDAAGLIAQPVSGTLLLFIGGLGPTLAAIGAAAAESGRAGVASLLKQAVRWRARPVWYAAAFGLPALVTLGGFGLGLALGEPLPPPPPVSDWLTLPGMFVLLLLLGAIEELGWRGYALPRLQAQYSPLRASLVLATLWGFWHAPQWFIPSTGQAGFPFPAFLLWVAALSILYSWIYNVTGGSILLVLFTHATTNAYPLPWLAALQTLPARERGVDPHLLVTVAQVGLALAVLALTRGRLGLVDAAPARAAHRRAGVARRLGRVGAALLGGLVVLGGVGALVQAVATERDRRAFPPPGQLVDVGGHRLHLQVMGEGQPGPTVVLEAGLDSFSTNWYWVQTDLASSMRVVAYDRAGLGWSEPGPPPRDARQSATELHAALRQADVRGPYVLAGHSYGGLVARVFRDLYPDEVVGLVLVDASHPDQWAHIPGSLGGRTSGAANRVLADLATVGLFRVYDPLTSQVAAGLPAHEYAEMQAIFALPRSSATGAETLAVWDDRTRPEVNGAASLGHLPLAVISVTEQPLYGDTLTALQAELARLSANSVHLTAAGATHETLISDREHAAVVARTIRDVAAAALPSPSSERGQLGTSGANP